VTGLSKKNLPNHIAIIPDGNRRFTKGRFMSPLSAYKAGARRVVEVAQWTREAGIMHMSVFGLSTENVDNRSELELSMVQEAALAFCDDVEEAGIQVHVFGDIERFRDDPKRAPLYRRFEAFNKKERNPGEFVLHVAANYSGSRDGNREYSSKVPNVDLLIRTGLYQRLSGFLPMQLQYAELHFLSVLWPEFKKTMLENALDWYGAQPRNFGK
jgi:undecaprenyl diphosphate synthase